MGCRKHRKYIDLLGMNVCISVGHSHPKVVAAAMEQAQDPDPLHHHVLPPNTCASGRGTGRHHA